MAVQLQEFEPIFGQANPQYEEASTNLNNNNNHHHQFNNPFLFRAFVPKSNPSHLTFHATDFRSTTTTFQATLSLHQLEDMRDSIGIGGSWSDFFNYVTSSFKSKDVKLILASQSKSNDATTSKLVARKSKGMPLISIKLYKLGSSAATEAMANMSLELFKAYAILRDSFMKEQEHTFQLSQVPPAEKEKSQSLKRKLDTATHLDGSHKASYIGNVVSSLNSDSSSVKVALNSSDEQPTREVKSTQVTHRVAPAHRRARTRGVVLRDTEEEGRD